MVDRRSSQHAGNSPVVAHGTVLPRWEWRVFEPVPGPFICRVAPHPPDGEVSHETYILSAASPNNVKIRCGQLDVKLLEDTAADGLELWRPVFKQDFPIAAFDLAPVWEACGVPSPEYRRSAYTQDQFIDELVGSLPLLRVVPVTKSRTRLMIAECRGEHAFLMVEAEQWETFALEDETSARISIAKDSLGPSLPPASNYPALLKRVVAMPEATPIISGASI